MKKIFKRTDNFIKESQSKKQSPQQGEAAKGPASSQSPVNARQQEAAEGFATTQDKPSLQTNIDNTILSKLQSDTLTLDALKKVVYKNKEMLEKLKQQSDAAQLNIYTNVCDNMNYVVKFVGVPQIEQYYEAIYPQFTELIVECQQMKNYFNSNQEKIYELYNRSHHELTDLKPKLTQSTAPAETSQDKKASRNVTKIFLKKAQNDASDASKTIDQSLLKAAINFIDTLMTINSIEFDYQIFVSEYQQFMQTKEVALEFRDTMMAICQAKTQYDADQADFGTGTREDLQTIISLYPVAIQYAKKFNNIVMSNLPQTTVRPTVTESLLTGRPLFERNKKNQLVPVEETVYQFEKNKNDQRNKILQSQLNYLVKIMQIDQRKYMLLPFKSLFRTVR